MNLTWTDFNRSLQFAFEKLSKDPWIPVVKAAREDFFREVGDLPQEFPLYEQRMNSFNDWFFFDYEHSENEKTYHIIFAEQPEMIRICDTVYYGLFEYGRSSIRRKEFLKDIITGKKVYLGEDHDKISLLEGEFFISRLISLSEQSYLLKGLCPIPEEAVGAVKKRARQVSKQSIDQTSPEFLLELENLTTKSHIYQHIRPVEIFKFK